MPKTPIGVCNLNTVFINISIVFININTMFIYIKTTFITINKAFSFFPKIYHYLLLPVLVFKSAKLRSWYEFVKYHETVS